MIHTDSLKKHIRFMIEHHGTKTQGEDFRLDQVTDYLVEMIIQLQAYAAAMENVRKDFPDQLPIFELAIY